MMKAIFVVIALAILAQFGHTQNMPKPGECGISTIKPKSESRIVNGQTANAHSRPYQMLLVGFFPNGTAKAYCGASLIKPTHVLTAAHCVQGYNAEHIRIFPAVHEFKLSELTLSNGQPVRQFFIHASYNNRSFTHDVAVLRLRVPMDVDNHKISLVCLAEGSSEVCKPGDPVVASGWGSMSGSPNRTSASRPTHLQEVALECFEHTHDDCKKLSHTCILGFCFNPDKSKMCAYGKNKGVCFGDSGGPLVRVKTLSDGTEYFEQVGIMSATIDCSFTKPLPDVYGDVRYFHTWIMDRVKESL